MRWQVARRGSGQPVQVSTDFGRSCLALRISIVVNKVSINTFTHRGGRVMHMNTTARMNARSVWSRVLIMVGSITMLVGALDPMEGSVVILPGSGLVALGTFLGQSERRLIAYRVWVFILIAIGVGAMWGLSSIGGFGGKTGRSMWWGVLILPYLIGWSMGIWGPGSPR